MYYVVRILLHNAATLWLVHCHMLFIVVVSIVRSWLVVIWDAKLCNSSNFPVVEKQPGMHIARIGTSLASSSISGVILGHGSLDGWFNECRQARLVER